MLDASVAAKLVLVDEPLRAQAVWWVTEHDQRRLQLVVPELFWTEIASLLRQAVARGRLAPASAQAAFASTLELALVTVGGPELAANALELGLACSHSCYGMIYAALAIRLGTHVVTADERWVRAAGTRLPLRWLGSGW